ncbi:hypothetical protein [Lentzea sp.]|uniref:hypothetical protein n=1 Tax=Lentzea sp. TaxID=56099 RepID=UPI002C3D4949|nr:hypothetical protein [Lentzea sp.]HUQ59033.1 hypothetical protein [Lentzea sp.]
MIGWSRHAIDDDLEYVELETDDQDDPLLVHTRRRAVPLRTLISLLERHAQRCGIATWGDLGMPDAVSTANLVINGVPTTGHVIDGGTVLAAVARAGAVSVSLVSSAARLERHGWPALVTARGQLR